MTWAWNLQAMGLSQIEQLTELFQRTEMMWRDIHKKVTLDEEWNEALDPGGIITSLYKAVEGQISSQEWLTVMGTTQRAIKL